MHSIVAPIALCLLFFLLHMVTSQNQESESLKIVHLIFRHGQRTPADTYPKDPFVKHSFEPFGWGQLTNMMYLPTRKVLAVGKDISEQLFLLKSSSDNQNDGLVIHTILASSRWNSDRAGKQAQFKQGEWLRERYSSFLGEKYSPDYLKAQSTDVDRAKMSTQLMLAGLWPPRGEQVWNTNLIWQPIPITSEPLKYDKLLLGRYPCPRYQEELEKVFKSPEVESIIASNRYLFKYASTQTGLTIDTPDDAQSLYSTLKAEKDFGLNLPDWTKQVFPKPLDKITAQSFLINAMSSSLQKLKGGFLLKKIIGDTNDKLQGNSKMKMFVYGGHDSTVSNFLLTLDAWDLQIPEYNSLIIVEVHQVHPDKHAVKVFLRNSTTDEPYLLQVPGCSQTCPWENFIRLTQNKVPTKSYKEECQSVNPNFVYKESTSGP